MWSPPIACEDEQLKIKVGNRRRSREIALQILYQWEVGAAPLDDTLAAAKARAGSMERFHWK